MRLTEHVSLLSGLLLDTSENVYAIRHEYGLVLIDTGWGEAAQKNILQSLQEDGLSALPVTHVLLTHMHDDHSGNAAWLRSRGAQIWCPEADASGVEAVRNSKVPILFVHGEADDFVPCDMSKACFEACGKPKRILTVPGAGHGLSHCVDKDSYEKLVQEFLDEVV